MVCILWMVRLRMIGSRSEVQKVQCIQWVQKVRVYGGVENSEPVKKFKRLAPFSIIGGGFLTGVYKRFQNFRCSYYFFHRFLTDTIILILCNKFHFKLPIVMEFFDSPRFQPWDGTELKYKIRTTNHK